MDRWIFGGHNPQRSAFFMSCSTLTHSEIRLVVSIPKINDFAMRFVFRKAEAPIEFDRAKTAGLFGLEHRFDDWACALGCEP